MALADMWWDLGQKGTGIAKTRILSHAGEWYEKALPDLSGLLKAEVNKRVQEIPTVFAAEPPGTINLLKLFGPECVVGGDWQMRDGALVSGEADGTRVEFPYQPPLEYDFRMEFSRLSGSDGVIQLIAAGGKQFGWSMGSKNNSSGGFDLISGKEAINNTTKVSLPIEVGKRYESVVQVRRDGVRAYVNGTLVCQWKTDYSDMGVYGGWRLRTGKNLGVGSWASSFIFYKIEVTEITGKGKIVR